MESVPDFSAIAQALGYYYQIRYALYVLLKSPIDNKISVENLDDISLTDERGEKNLIQLKHRDINIGNLTNASSDLWKTIRIWSTLISNREIDPSKTKFILITTGTCPEKSASSMLIPPKSDKRDYLRALEILSQVTKTSRNKKLKSSFEALTNLDPQERTLLFRNLLVVDKSSDIRDLKDEILDELKLAVPIKFVAKLFTDLEGWWFQRIITHLTSSKPEPISVRDLYTYMNGLRNRYSYERLTIDPTIVKKGKKRLLDYNNRLFVKQLRIIKIEDTLIALAVSDFYCANEQRTKWIKDDLIYIEELDYYDDRLFREWEFKFEIMKRKLGSSPDDELMIESGANFYFDICKNYSLRIRPEVLEEFVMRGSYHLLSDELKVGWHLNYRKILS